MIHRIINNYDNKCYRTYNDVCKTTWEYGLKKKEAIKEGYTEEATSELEFRKPGRTISESGVNTITE